MTVKLNNSYYIAMLLLVTVVEGDQKAPFLIATPFPGLLQFTLDTHLIMLCVKHGGTKYHFLKVFGMTRPGIEPWSPGPLANTPPTRRTVYPQYVNE